MPNQKKLLYNASKSLQIRYRFHSEKEHATLLLDGRVPHTGLYEGVNDLLKAWEYLGYKVDINGINFATGYCTLLFSDTDTDEGYLGEEIKSKIIPLNCEKPIRVVSTLDFYDMDLYKQRGVPGNKAKRCCCFNDSLNQRILNFNQIKNQFDYPSDLLIDSSRKLDEKISDPMFHEIFHHSEQAMMHYLSSSLGVQMLANVAKKAGAAYVYGIVLDIYSQRMLCGNCNISLLGMQNSYSKGFLFDFKKQLDKPDYRIQTRSGTGLMLSSRVSVSKANKGSTMDPLRLHSDPPNKVYPYNPDQTNVIFQANNEALRFHSQINPKSYSLLFYAGSFFTSQKIKNKEKLEKRLVICKKDSDRLPEVKWDWPCS